MTCLVCDHSKRYRIETALRSGTPKTRVAKEFGIRRATLHDHISKKHEEKNPAKAPEVADPDDEVVDFFPNDYHIRGMTSRAERIRHVERMLNDRRFYGSESIAKLARLWRDILGKDAEKQVAEMVAEVFKRQTIAHGPKALRKQFAMVEILSLYRECRESGDRKTAATLFAQYIELDNLKDDPSAVHRQIIAQFVQIVQVGAPHLLPHIQEVTARLEEGYEQAKAIVEGETLPPIVPLPEAESVQEAPPTPRCEELKNAGIDTGIPRNDDPSSET